MAAEGEIRGRPGEVRGRGVARAADHTPSQAIPGNLPNRMGRRRKGGAPRGQGPDPGPSRVERWLRGAFDARGAGNLREAEKLARRVIDAGSRSTRRAAPARDGRARERPYRSRHRPVPSPASPASGNSYRAQQPRQSASGTRPVAGGDRLLRSRPRPRPPLHLRLFQSRARVAARERSGPCGTCPATGGGARTERCPGPLEARPSPRRAGQAGGGDGADASLARARTGLHRDPQRCRRRPFHHRRTSTPLASTIAPPSRWIRASPRLRSTSRSRSVSPRGTTRTRTASAPRSSTAPRTRARSATCTSRSARFTTTAESGRPRSRTTSVPTARSPRLPPGRSTNRWC